MSTWGRRGLPANIRTHILRRDHGECQLGYPGCLGFATEVDHIVNVAALGIGRDEANHDELLQACCTHCHAIKPTPNAWRHGRHTNSGGANVSDPCNRILASGDDPGG